MTLLLEDHEAVHATLDGFNLTEPEIRSFFLEHGVSPSGTVDLASMMCAGILAMVEDGEPLTGSLLMALFTGGVAMGLQLADERDAAKRRPLLRLLHPGPERPPRG